MWFNLNKVQPPVRGTKPLHGKRIGEPFVDPLKYAVVQQREFPAGRLDGHRSRCADQRASSLATARKTGRTRRARTRRGTRQTSSSTTTTRKKRKSCSPAWDSRTRTATASLEDARGNPVTFMLKTNSSNALRLSMANFIRDDLAKVGIRMTLTPIDFNTLISNMRSDFQYEAMLLGFQSSVPPTPFGGQNVWRSSGESHNLVHPPAEARHTAGGAHRPAARRDADDPGRSGAEGPLEGNREHHQRSGLVHLAAHPTDQAAGEQPVRQRAAERHGAPHPLEHRSRVT